MTDMLKTTKGKLALLLGLYVPFFCALFFQSFDDRTFESPIGGCCLSMEGVVVAAYALFTLWVLAPTLLLYAIYRLSRRG